MKIQFKLKDPKSTSKTSIRLVAYVKGERLVYSIGESIDPVNWDLEKQRVIIPRGDKNLADKRRAINTIIERAQLKLGEVETEIKNSGLQVNVLNLKEKLSDELGSAKDTKSIYVFDYISYFINDITSGEITTEQGNKFAEGTIKAYKGTLRHLKNYQEKYRIKLRFDRLNLDFYNKYRSYLVSLSYKPNTIGKDFKNLKVIAKRAKDSGISVNIQAEKFKTINVPVDVTYLNVDELAKIESVDLSKKPMLDNARDLFVLVCWTGLRYSDIARLTDNSLVKDKTRIKLNTKKTTNAVEIPVWEPVKRLLSKYDGFPRIISNPKLNEYIKAVCKEAGIIEPMEVSEIKDGLVVKKYKPKYKLITVHTGRRSFATNLYKSGKITTWDIMSLTGHKSESSFYRYIRITPEESADRLQGIDISLSPLKKVK